MRISPPTIKLAASNAARLFIGVQTKESQICVNFAHPEAQNRTNRPARWPRKRHPNVNITVAIYRAACGRRIGMCGYPSVPFIDGSSCFFLNLISRNTAPVGLLYVVFGSQVDTAPSPAFILARRHWSLVEHRCTNRS